MSRGWVSPPGKIGKLSLAEIDAFLAQPWNARLGVVTPESTPYIVAVWYQYDPTERVFYIVARAKSSYVEYLKRNPAVAIHVADDVHLEHTRVLVEGHAEIIEGPIPPEESPRMRDLVISLSRKYLGEKGTEYALRTMKRARYLIKVVPDRWHSWTGTEWGRRYRE
jgi:nitroimidazol reductase NimA-like FMN-containing flavoprotein (pyridoxamine 5'-phosphate oxidase superfamily)